MKCSLSLDFYFCLIKRGHFIFWVRFLFCWRCQRIYKTCRHCGRIHKEGYVCSKRSSKNKKKADEASRFRSTFAWQEKRRQIKERDNYLCQVCIRDLYNTWRKYNHQGLQVHHAVPIDANEELRLEDSNLITLCLMHHAMCDKSEIPYDEIKEIIIEQERTR